MSIYRTRTKSEINTQPVGALMSEALPPSTHTPASVSFKPKIIYQTLRKNVYSPSAWYVPFVITLGSILLLGLLVSLGVLLAKAVHRHCPCKTAKHKKPL